MNAVRLVWLRFPFQKKFLVLSRRILMVYQSNSWTFVFLLLVLVAVISVG